MRENEIAKQGPSPYALKQNVLDWCESSSTHWPYMNTTNKEAEAEDERTKEWASVYQQHIPAKLSRTRQTSFLSIANIPSLSNTHTHMHSHTHTPTQTRTHTHTHLLVLTSLSAHTSKHLRVYQTHDTWINALYKISIFFVSVLLLSLQCV